MNENFGKTRTFINAFLPERDYVTTFGSLLGLSQIRLSSVTFVRSDTRPSCVVHAGIETFGNISSPFCTLAIL